MTTNLAIWQSPNKPTWFTKMTRGRRKDTTVPPSRSLIVQRAYRDRKAKYLSDLEDRCRKVEEENERLRNELELARSEPTAPIVNGELVRKFRATFSGKKDDEPYFLKPRIGSGVL